MDTSINRNVYTLRARVIEGSIPMPRDAGAEFEGLTENNFEIICGYTPENFKRLFEISKDAYENGDLVKFEILGWAGGAANEDGDRFLWSFRPDLYNFERIPEPLMAMFLVAEPRPMTDEIARQYDRFWRPLKFGFSLAAYEAKALGITRSEPMAKNIRKQGRAAQPQAEKPPLDNVIRSAQRKKAEKEAGKRALICLTANEDRTWTAAATNLDRIQLTGATALVDDEAKKVIISGPDADSISAPWVAELTNYYSITGRQDRMDYSMSPARDDDRSMVPLVKEKSYPVDVIYYRTDINGSGMLESVTCKDREDLLSTLDWLGKCGFVPEQVWDFDSDKEIEPRLLDIFRAGQQRRHEIAQSEMEAFLLDDDDTPMFEMPQVEKNPRKTHEPER